ncbi:MAG: hypothetical protein OQK98_07555 [Gammaproteobacteria bacterium]|nr:hypothetical protein [Gammaproteobacteria bacterium]
MKSPILTLLILFSLLAVNIASAMNMHIEESGESHLAHIQGEAELASNNNEADCDDHSCHLSLHMLGIISNIDSIFPVTGFMALINFDDSIKYQDLDPPSEPPQA